MVHECDLGWQGEGNVLSSGVPKLIAATAQERPIHTIVVYVLISGHAYQGPTSWREQSEPVDNEPNCPSSQF
jgi:hypothetical protein